MVAEPVTTDPTTLRDMPIWPYDPAWLAFNRKFPNIPKSLGAAAADEGAEGDGGDGDGGEGAGDGDGAGDGEGTGGEGQGDGDAAAKTAAAEKAKKADSEPDWRDAIDDSKVRTFADRFPTPVDAMNFAFEQRQKLSNAITPPGEDASDEEKVEFAKTLATFNGVPESAEGYEISLPDDLPEQLQLDDAGKVRMKEFTEAMHALGAPPAAVQGAINFYYQMGGEALTAQAERRDQDRQERIDALTKEWGNDFDRRTEMARRVATDPDFFGESFATFLEESELDGVKLGDYPEMARGMAHLAQRMTEDSLHLRPGGSQATDIQSRIDEIHAMEFGDDDAKIKFKSKTVQTELSSLYTQLHGEQPYTNPAAA